MSGRGGQRSQVGDQRGDLFPAEDGPVPLHGGARLAGQERPLQAAVGEPAPHGRVAKIGRRRDEARAPWAVPAPIDPVTGGAVAAIERLALGELVGRSGRGDPQDAADQQETDSPVTTRVVLHCGGPSPDPESPIKPSPISSMGAPAASTENTWMRTWPSDDRRGGW